MELIKAYVRGEVFHNGEYKIVTVKDYLDEIMSWGELKREFRRAGCYKISEGGNHEWWYSPITNRKFQMGRHDIEGISKQLEMKLRKQAGVPKKR